MYWPLLDMYSEILDLGQRGFIIRGTFNKRMNEGINGIEAFMVLILMILKQRSLC